MTSIMFICHGNICRSPMAEIIFKDIVRRNRRENDFIISSAATSSEEIYRGQGNPIYPPAKAELKKRGYIFPEHFARLLKKEDYDKYDIFVGMDSVNIRNMQRIFAGDPDGKIKKLLDYCSGGDVSDPWYTDRFDTAYSDILRGCKALYDFLTEKH